MANRKFHPLDAPVHRRTSPRTQPSSPDLWPGRAHSKSRRRPLRASRAQAAPSQDKHAPAFNPREAIRGVAFFSLLSLSVWYEWRLVQWASEALIG